MSHLSISGFRKLRVGIYLLFRGEIWFRDDGFGVDDEICIIWKMTRIMSDRDSESLTSKSIEKW